jgi:predicted molibdopterin-dependent oxidoreductase YjgC
MTGTIFWNGTAIPFRTGESVATALLRAGINAFGTAHTGQARAVFCGIGLCQGCLVRAEGRLTEACLLAASDGLHLSSEIAGGEDV